jgi:hypothetical protein
MALADVLERVGHLLERIGPLDDGRDLAGVEELAQRLQARLDSRSRRTARPTP